MLLGLIGFGLTTLLSNAYVYFTYRESYEQFLYKCFPNLEKLTEEELNHIQSLIGHDPRVPKHTWIW